MIIREGIIIKTMVPAIAAATLLAATTATADGYLKYGEVEGWKVFIDQGKKSCLIEKVDALENVVQMGLTKDRGIGYLGVFTKAKTDIKAGRTAEIAIMVGENIYLGQATGMRGNITQGYSGGYVISNDPQFADDLARQYTAMVFPEKEYAFEIDLTGTMKAMEMARQCNADQLK